MTGLDNVPRDAAWMGVLFLFAPTRDALGNNALLRAVEGGDAKDGVASREHASAGASLKLAFLREASAGAG